MSATFEPSALADSANAHQNPESDDLAASVSAAVAAAALNGLSSRPRTLPPWLFYDAAGSALFERITELPEYYLTRTERGIFAAHASEIISEAAGGDRLAILELGAGTAAKTGLLLRAAVAQQGDVVYHPIDVSETALQQAQVRLQTEVPGVVVVPQVADYTRGLHIGPTIHGERRLVLYIGSSIGNFPMIEASDLLRNLREQLRPGDSLLLGTDLAPGAGLLRTGSSLQNGNGDHFGAGTLQTVKNEARLVAAYDDSAGVTAEFNLNILRRLNRELGANFDLGAFRHLARWNSQDSRIEMHLQSLREQQVTLAALDLKLDFAAGETIHTENSRKFTPESVRALLRGTGYRLARRWTDPAGWFGVHLAFAD